jgi:hypothetical protein
MNKEEIKEDIIRDINNLLSKDSKDENINELFNGSMNEKKQIQQNPQVMPQQKVSMPNQQLTPQQIQQMQQHQMQQQMQQQQMQQQMQQQQMQQHQMQQQMQQQQMQQPQMQGHLQHMQHPGHNQLSPQQQQLLNQQLLQQGINPQMLQQQGINPQMLQRLNPAMLKEHLANQNNTSDSISNMIFSQRDSLVLFLLYVILLTPQINSIMNKIPYTSDNDNYPGYLGILLRGVIFISLYIGMKNLNLI